MDGTTGLHGDLPSRRKRLNPLRDRCRWRWHKDQCSNSRKAQATNTKSSDISLFFLSWFQRIATMPPGSRVAQIGLDVCPVAHVDFLDGCPTNMHNATRLDCTRLGAGRPARRNGAAAASVGFLCEVSSVPHAAPAA